MSNASIEYKVLKAFKSNGEALKPGDIYIAGGIWDHKLLSTRYIEKVDTEKMNMEANSKRKLAEQRQASLHPEGFTCGCGFVAKSKAGLVAHSRKHNTED